MVQKVTGSYKLTYHPEGPDGVAWEADFTPPFRRIDMMEGLGKALGVTMPSPDKLDTAGRLRTAA